MHERDDLSCTRGYEFYLLREAKRRNPDILTYALSWGVPHWVGNGSYFSEVGGRNRCLAILAVRVVLTNRD
jgi:hypothetical protein